MNYIYSHNNITWRNFNVVAMGQHRGGGGIKEFIPLPFVISGAWDQAHEFVFETFAQLPERSRLALQVPHWLGRGFKPAHTDLEEQEDADTDPDDRRRVRIKLDAQGSHRIGHIELHAKTTSPSHLLVHIPEEDRQRAHEVAIRQIYKGREVGRITWRLVA